MTPREKIMKITKNFKDDLDDRKIIWRGGIFGPLSVVLIVGDKNECEISLVGRGFHKMRYTSKTPNNAYCRKFFKWLGLSPLLEFDRAPGQLSRIYLMPNWTDWPD